MSLVKAGRGCRLLIQRSVTRLYSSGEGTTGSGSNAPADVTPAQPAAPSKPAAPEVSPPEPFDNTKYKCDQYYEYNPLSFYDIEVDMSANRVGQPSSKNPAK